MLIFGERGEEVEKLQIALNKTGAGLIVDGYFGYATQFAVRLFQANNGLNDDGKVGAITWKALNQKIERLEAPETDVAELVLVRDIATPNSITGQLFLNGDFMGYTMERPWKNNQVKVSCIPVGTYKIDVKGPGESHRFWYPHLQVLNVPKRSVIVFQRANYPEDVKGSIGVGRTRSIDFIGNTRAAHTELMAAVEKFKEVNLTIKQA